VIFPFPFTNIYFIISLFTCEDYEVFGTKFARKSQSVSDGIKSLVWSRHIPEQ